MTSIIATTTADAWAAGLAHIWRYGRLVTIADPSGRQVETVEYMGLRTEILNPVDIPKNYYWGKTQMGDYREQFLSPENPGFAYTYGERLRAWGKNSGLHMWNFTQCERLTNDLEGYASLDEIELDQIKYMIDKLRANKTSRRAVAVTWIPPRDELSEEPPCLMYLEALVRDNKLHLIAPYRSHDFYGAYPANAYGLFGVLQFIADEVDVEYGSLTFFSGSAHIYQFDWPRVAEILSKEQPWEGTYPNVKRAVYDVPEAKKRMVKP